MNLHDGHDEIFPLPQPSSNYRAVEAAYQRHLNRIKRVESGLVSTYTCPEFLELKEWLKRTIGDDRANQIMNNNI